MMDLTTLGEAIKTARKGLGMTQTDLASHALVSRPTIARLETGRATDLGYRSLVRILNQVGLDLRLTTLNRERPTLDDIMAEGDAP
jgi:transcriptional regulator with XRE-family HTH domain